MVVVGGGPAGLAAARELGRLGVRDVVVIEREREAGEIPHQLAEAVYQKVQAEQAASQPAGDGGNGAPEEDEVVEEADYEVIDEEAKRS